MLTPEAGLAAVAGEEHRIVAVQVGTVLLDVFAVYFPKHFATTALLLPRGEKKKKERQRSRHVSRCPDLRTEFDLLAEAFDWKLIWRFTHYRRDPENRETERERELTGSQWHKTQCMTPKGSPRSGCHVSSRE